MNQLSSTPSFLREQPAPIGERAAAWLRDVAVRARWLKQGARADLLRRDDLEEVDDAAMANPVSCPRAERAWFAAAIVAIYALVSVLGLEPAAVPLVLGGIGVALMILWIGWYWPDDA